jgi:hypothetical protein
MTHTAIFMSLVARIMRMGDRQPFAASAERVLRLPRCVGAAGRGLLASMILLPIVIRGAVASDAVLLSSTIPAYVPGMVIAATDRLMLPEGASATLLFQSGQMLRLRGPFEGSLEHLQSASAGESVPALAEAFRLRGVDAAVIGGTRTAGTPLHLALDNVQIDPQHSGIYCLQTSTSIWISRPPGAGGEYGLRWRGNTRAIAFPAGAARIEWPDDVSIEDGDRFEIVTNGRAQATVIFRTMSEHPASDAAWIAEGILHGCRNQFDAALRQLGQ